MASVVRTPTPTILQIGELLNSAIDDFLKARNTIQGLGKWEAALEANNLFNLVIRDIESIVELARVDLVLLPGANVLARAVFEISLKAAWMVQPEDPFQRELRWLAHIEEEARMHERLVPKIARFGGNPEFYEERGRLLRKFQEAVASKLPTDYLRLPGNPSVEQMLEGVGQRQVYPIYVLLCSFVHGTHESTWLYRQNLGSLKKHGDFVSSDDWHLPLWTCWRCLQVLGQYVLYRLGTGATAFISPEQCIEIEQAFNRLREDEREPNPF